MRWFYFVWFVLAAAGGASISTTPPSMTPHVGLVLLVLPLSFVCGTLYFKYALRRLFPGKLASAPSLRVVPWNLPTGSLQFISLTFAFVGAWALLFTVVLDHPSVGTALHFLSLGLGPYLAILHTYKEHAELFEA